MFKRTLYCFNCNREVQGGEEIYAKMKAPKNTIMVEIKAYLKKESEIFCADCMDKEK
ncbi:Fe3+ hydroxamate ABC transporter substrate-binding protein [Psychrobacillus sp. NPDC096389]|uniref:Fe3+ hydroxamate ABC transporter substrate-binding protein n=1 Tax=Psychrobacillus sp. NPDC096389 TaxID=3364490 RepID=UPI00380094D8